MHRVLAILTLPLAIVMACKSDTEEKSPQDAYPGRFSQAVCASMEPCCRANGLGFDRGKCELGGAAFVQQGVDAAKARGATFDGANADACIAGASRLAQSCLPTGSDNDVSAACGSVHAGKNQPGQPCESDLDCAPGPEGRGSCHRDGSGAGTCVLLRSPASVGDTCSVPSGQPIPRVLADCTRSDLQCSLAGTCQPLTAIGDACVGFIQCVKDAFCDASNKCAPKLPALAACTKDAECSSGACIRGKCGRNGLGTVAPCTGESG